MIATTEATAYSLEWERLSAVRTIPISWALACALPCRTISGARPSGTDNLYFTPTDAPNPRSKRLHDGFLGRESACQLWRPTAAVGPLSRGVYLLQKPLRVTSRHLRDSADFYNVDARVYQ